jgi:hypothetical protein
MASAYRSGARVILIKGIGYINLTRTAKAADKTHVHVRYVDKDPISEPETGRIDIGIRIVRIDLTQGRFKTNKGSEGLPNREKGGRCTHRSIIAVDRHRGCIKVILTLVRELKSSADNRSISNTQNHKTDDRTHQLTPFLWSAINDVPSKSSTKIGTKVIRKIHLGTNFITYGLRHAWIEVVSGTLIV